MYPNVYTGHSSKMRNNQIDSFLFHIFWFEKKIDIRCLICHAQILWNTTFIDRYWDGVCNVYIYIFLQKVQSVTKFDSTHYYNGIKKYLLTQFRLQIIVCRECKFSFNSGFRELVCFSILLRHLARELERKTGNCRLAIRLRIGDYYLGNICAYDGWRQNALSLQLGENF